MVPRRIHRHEGQDSEDESKLLTAHLKRDGYNVISAPDAVFATTTARSERPDLILLDIQLPGGDGFVVLKRLKGIAELTRTPVIVMTAFDEYTEGTALKEGAVAFLKKPIDKDTLLTTVRRVVTN